MPDARVARMMPSIEAALIGLEPPLPFGPGRSNLLSSTIGTTDNFPFTDRSA
jgi:hypothetical protein